MQHRVNGRCGSGLAATLLLTGAAAALAAGVTKVERVSVSSAGEQGNSYSSTASLSADGRYVAFVSNSDNLVPDDTNGSEDVFVRDRTAGATERVSVSSTGAQGNAARGFSVGANPAISADGRFVAFESFADTFAAGDTNTQSDIFVRDRVTRTTELISAAAAGAPDNSFSQSPAISADGRYVAFQSQTTDLVPGDTNAAMDIFVRDRTMGTTERVSLSSAGAQANGGSYEPAISADGRFVAFESDARNLVPGDTNNSKDIFLRDRTSGTTERVSLSSTGAEGDGTGFFPTGVRPAISANGRFVAFESFAQNLVDPATDRTGYIFVRDRSARTTEIIRLPAADPDAGSGTVFPALSGDGRCLAFRSGHHVFVMDRTTGALERISVSAAGVPGNQYSDLPSLSADGRCIAYQSEADNLVPNDTNRLPDVFLAQRIESRQTDR